LKKKFDRRGGGGAQRGVLLAEGVLLRVVSAETRAGVVFADA